MVVSGLTSFGEN